VVSAASSASKNLFHNEEGGWRWGHRGCWVTPGFAADAGGIGKKLVAPSAARCPPPGALFVKGVLSPASGLTRQPVEDLAPPAPARVHDRAVVGASQRDQLDLAIPGRAGRSGEVLAAA